MGHDKIKGEAIKYGGDKCNEAIAEIFNMIFETHETTLVKDWASVSNEQTTEATYCIKYQATCFSDIIEESTVNNSAVQNYASSGTRTCALRLTVTACVQSQKKHYRDYYEHTVDQSHYGSI